MKNILIFLQKINKVPTRIITVFGILWGLVEMLNHFNCKPFDNNLLAFILFGVLICVVEEFITYATKKERKSTMLFTDSILAYFQELQRKNKPYQIVRWGIAISKPLWVSHKYKIRRDIGKFVNIAAKAIKDEKAQIYTLVNDIGWTNVELLQYDEAVKNITEGIKLLDKAENTDYYLLAKAHRHLVSINIRTDAMNKKLECEKHLKLCEEATRKYIELREGTTNIYELNKQNRLLAEFYFAKATYEYKCGNSLSAKDTALLNSALNNIIEAENLFQKIPSRNWTIKIMARKGDILLSLDKDDDALRAFEEGKKIASDATLCKSLVKNLIGLSDYYSKKGENQTALIHLNDALKTAKEKEMLYEESVINRKINKIKEKL
jgi:hypothetical protein